MPAQPGRGPREWARPRSRQVACSKKTSCSGRHEGMATLNLRQTSFRNWCVLVAVLVTFFTLRCLRQQSRTILLISRSRKCTTRTISPGIGPSNQLPGISKGTGLIRKTCSLLRGAGTGRTGYRSLRSRPCPRAFSPRMKRSSPGCRRTKTTRLPALPMTSLRCTSLSLPTLAGFGLYGLAAGDPVAKETFLLGAESVVITAAFVQTLKRSFGRHRPYTGDSHDTWSGPVLFDHGEDLSFPSGDASTAFAIASVVAAEYDNAVVPPVVYTLSSLVALERVHNNAHWSSDVFVGSVIGYFTGKAVVRSHAAGKGNNLSVAPLMVGKSPGVVVTLRY